MSARLSAAEALLGDIGGTNTRLYSARDPMAGSRCHARSRRSAWTACPPRIPSDGATTATRRRDDERGGIVGAS